MNLLKHSQRLFVEEPIDQEQDNEQEVSLNNKSVLVFHEEPSEDLKLNLTNLEHQEEASSCEPEAKIEISFKLPSIPGCDSDEVLEVKEEGDDDQDGDEDVKEVIDENDARSKKKDQWDWQSLGAKEFLTWMKKMLSSVPKHSGKDSGGIERAIAFLKKLDSEISKAMQSDFDGEIDASKVEEARTEIDDGIERLENRLSSVIEKFKGKKKKKAQIENASLNKTAQKAPSVGGIIVTVPLFISMIARICINSSVSAGKDIEDVFFKQAKKWKLDDRERAEVIQLLSDMNYTVRADRGHYLDGDVYEDSEDNFDWSPNYQA